LIGLVEIYGAVSAAVCASKGATTAHSTRTGRGHRCVGGQTPVCGHPGLHFGRRGDAVPSCPIYGEGGKGQRRSSCGARRGLLAV